MASADSTETNAADAYAPDLDIGQVQWACSEEDSGPDVGMLLRLSETDFIWCGEITNAEAKAAEVSDMGWHIVLHQGAEREVIASLSATLALDDLLHAIGAAVKAAARSIWQPIATAPEDELIYVGGRHLDGSPWWNVGYRCGEYWDCGGAADPLHWMPLPPLPEQEPSK